MNLEKRIKDLYFAGYSTGEIAKKLNIAEYIVVRVLNLD